MDTQGSYLPAMGKGLDTEEPSLLAAKREVGPPPHAEPGAEPVIRKKAAARRRISAGEVRPTVRRATSHSNLTRCLFSFPMTAMRRKQLDDTDQQRQERMAIRVQRALRVRWHVYKNFGPDLFVDAHGRTGQSGKIAFQVTVAKWIRVADFTAAIRLNNLLTYHWCLPRPEVLISITGGAQEFSLPPQLLRAFSHGLASTALAAKAWIFSGGSDTGVMKLVGDTVRHYDIRTPVIGVFPWGAVNNRDLLEVRGWVCRAPCGVCRGSWVSYLLFVPPFHAVCTCCPGGGRWHVNLQEQTAQ